MHDEAHIESAMNDSQVKCTKNTQIERDVSPSVGTQCIAPAITSMPAVIPNTPSELDMVPSLEPQSMATSASRMRALVLRAPGINCDRETAQACRMAGFETDLVHINELIKAPDSLLDYQFLVIPGGFSYGDDLGAGTLLAKNLTIHLGDQLRRFIDEGRPVLGICNGFQVLVRAGLLPGSATELSLRATLTENASATFECRWITMAVQPSPCIFTRGIEWSMEMPVAHGEGQFVLEDAKNIMSASDAGEPTDAINRVPTLRAMNCRISAVDRLQTNGQVPLVYVAPGGDLTQPIAYPANPNGSLGNIAGVCNVRGNVFGLMPHPERFVTMLQHPQRRSSIGKQADGLLIFKNAYNYVLQSLHDSPQKSPLTLLSDLSTGTRFITSAGPLASTEFSTPISYTDSGVDITAGEHAVNLMKDAVRATHGPEVLAGIGAFAGAFSAKALQKMRHPVLVSSTDGVGTKTLIAAQAERYETIGYDLVNHSINDLLMQGARPLFFMDYIAMGKLDPVHAATIVKGVANACREAGCALLGGETAEMPDVYLPSAFDLAGTIVGVAEEDEIVNGSTICTGDVILGLSSNGLHTNGYSLARRVFAPYALDTVFPELGEPLVNALLQPHRCYLHEISQLRDYLADRGRYIKGMAHITGGGFEGNITRILPSGMQAIVDTSTWNVPPLFQLISRLGSVPQAELYRILNMGIGVVIVLSPKSALEARCILPELLTIGNIVEGEGVILTNIKE